MVARVYGKYAPTSDDRDRWEKIAAKLDADRELQKSKKFGEMGTDVVPHLRTNRANHG